MRLRRPLKAQLQAELAAAEDEETCEKIRAAFNSREKGLEHDLDHKPMSFDLELSVGYNCAPPARTRRARSLAHAPPRLPRAVLSK